jgi:hypothetical protein
MSKKTQLGMLSIIILVLLPLCAVFGLLSNNTSQINHIFDSELSTIPPETEIRFDLNVTVGCEIALGSDKDKVSPSEQWIYYLQFEDVSGLYDANTDTIKDLDQIITTEVENWLMNNVKNKGRTKKMLDRYVILNYNYLITDWGENPQ